MNLLNWFHAFIERNLKQEFREKHTMKYWAGLIESDFILELHFNAKPTWRVPIPPVKPTERHPKDLRDAPKHAKTANTSMTFP